MASSTGNSNLERCQFGANCRFKKAEGGCRYDHSEESERKAAELISLKGEFGISGRGGDHRGGGRSGSHQQRFGGPRGGGRGGFGSFGAQGAQGFVQGLAIPSGFGVPPSGPEGAFGEQHAYSGQIVPVQGSAWGMVPSMGSHPSRKPHGMTRHEHNLLENVAYGVASFSTVLEGGFSQLQRQREEDRALDDQRFNQVMGAMATLQAGQTEMQGQIGEMRTAILENLDSTFKRLEERLNKPPSND